MAKVFDYTGHLAGSDSMKESGKPLLTIGISEIFCIDFNSIELTVKIGTSSKEINLIILLDWTFPCEHCQTNNKMVILLNFHKKFRRNFCFSEYPIYISHSVLDSKLEKHLIMQTPLTRSSTQPIILNLLMHH